MQYRPIFFLAVFRAYLPYKLPVLPPKYFVGPSCYVLRYARQILVGCQICTSGESASQFLVSTNSQGICFHGSWCGNKRSPSRHGSLHIASILLFQSQKRHHAASKENKLLQRQRCLCHQLKIPPRKLRCTESSRGNLWCQTACLSRYRLIWSFCFAADHPETQRSSITSTSFFSSNFFTQPRSAFPALVAATLASSFS